MLAGNVVHGQLTVIDFNGTGQTLNTAANYSPSTVPSASDLIDVTGVKSSSGTNSAMGIYATTPPTNNTFSIGGIAFDSIGAGSPVDLDASTSTSSTAAITLALTGGNTGTTNGGDAPPPPNTNAGDLLAITSNIINGTVNFRGGNGGLTVNVPAGGGNFDIAAGDTLEMSSFKNTTSGTTYYASIANNLSDGVGADPITITGGGTLLLANTVTAGENSGFTGGWIISNGTLNIAAAADLGSTTSTTIGADGTLTFSSTSANPSGAGSSRAFVLGGSTSTIDVKSGTAFAIEGPLQNPGGGTGTLNKTDSGALLLQSTSASFTGGTVVTAGTLGLNTGADLGPNPAAPATDLTLYPGTTLLLDGASSNLGVNRSIVLGSAASAGSVTIDASYGENAIIASAIGDNTGGANSLIVASDTNGYVATGTAVGTGSSGVPGTVILSGNNTYGGGTTINIGATALVGNNGFGSAGGSLGPGTVTNNGTLALNRSDTAFTFGNLIAGSGNVLQTGTGTTTVTGSNTYSGFTSVNAGILSISTIPTAGSGGNPGPLGQSSNDPGNLILSGGTLQYTGAAVDVDRLFTIAATGGTIDSSGAGPMNFNNGGAVVSSDPASRGATESTSSMTVFLSNAADLAVGMTVTGTGISSGTTITAVNSAVVNFASYNSVTLNQAPTIATNSTTPATLSFTTTSRTLTLTGTNTDANIMGDILSDSSGGGQLNLVKAGNGAWDLTAVNTYTGQTNVTQGTLTVDFTGAIASGTVGISSGATLNANGSLAPTAIVNVSGNLIFGYPGAGLVVRPLGALNIAAGGSVALADPVLVTNRQVLITPSLTFAGSTGAWSGLLDLANNDMIVTGAGAAGLATVTNQIQQGLNLAGPGSLWAGSAGIVSSSAAASTNTALGSELNDDGSGNVLIPIFDGQSVGTADVLVKYTYYGDANLDGVVNGSDYTLIDNGFNNSLTGWHNGDFNYDGVVNGDDYTLIDNAFNTQGPALTGTALSMVAAATEQIAGSSSAAVPEPTTLGLIAFGAAGLLTRRRRSN